MPISPWVRDLFAALDRKDVSAFGAFLAEDAFFRFGSQPEARGRAAAEAAVEAFFGMIAGLSHELTGEWEGPGSVVVEGQVTYTRRDGTTVTLPFVDVLDMRGSRIQAYKIYMDIAPLFGAPS